MSERPPTTVLLPTTEWTDACAEVAEQLLAGDELLVVCDTEADPVADHPLPRRTSLVVAGDPDGCSGKANAIATGMQRAATDRASGRTTTSTTRQTGSTPSTPTTSVTAR